jgi:hypothetical protein
MSVKLYYRNCSGYQELRAAHSTAVACAQVNSLIQTASIVQTLLLSSTVTALPPPCSNSSVPITQNLLQAKLHAALQIVCIFSQKLDILASVLALVCIVFPSPQQMKYAIPRKGTELRL